MQNLYQLFGVPNFASLEEIATAYKKIHTELFSSDSPLANIPKLRKLKDAFDTFADDNKRDIYDKNLKEFLKELSKAFDEALEALNDRNLQEAFDKLKWCISKDPGEPDYYETIGLVYRLANDYDNAIKSYKQGLGTGQRKAFFHRNLADIYELKYDEDNSETHLLEAAEAFKEILEVNSEDVEAIEQMAEIYRKMKFHEEAIELYDQLLRRFPNNATYHREIGGVFYDFDIPEESEKHLLEALRLSPGDPHTLLYLGLTYFKRRLLGMAIQTLQDSLKKNPEQQEVKQLIEQIEIVRSKIGKTVEEIIYDPAYDAYVEGQVKWYNPETGMGVLTCSEYPEVLLHYSAIKNEFEVSLRKGDLVKFGVVKDEMSPIAVQVEIIDKEEISASLPGKILHYDIKKKVGTIKSHDGREIFFMFSALTEETIENLKQELDVLFESKRISNLSDNTIEQAVRVRLRRKKILPDTPKPTDI